MQVVMGGGVDPEGKGFVAEKVIKLPTKRIPDAVRYLLDNYEDQASEGEYFNDYFNRQGKRYFYDLLKPLADLESLVKEDHFDWGQNKNYQQEIGVGECAGVTLDVVGTIIQESRDKVELAKESLEAGIFADSIYHSYAAFVIGAKALLLSKDVKCNTHKGILDDFQTHYVENGEVDLDVLFSEFVLRINKQEPSEAFAKVYLEDATTFVKQVITIREQQLVEAKGADKLVIDNYYKA
jgi:sulfite reductase (ferredoxin)